MVTSELLAEEVVWTLVGRVGLVVWVPITAVLTGFVATRHRHPGERLLSGD